MHLKISATALLNRVFIAVIIFSLRGVATADTTSPEEYVNQYGSFELGEFTPSPNTSWGDHWLLQREGPNIYNGALHGWENVSWTDYGDRILWMDDPNQAAHGDRFLSLAARIYGNSRTGIVRVQHRLFMNLGTKPDGALFSGPALTVGQTYELSFMARDFGSTTNTPLVVEWVAFDGTVVQFANYFPANPLAESPDWQLNQFYFTPDTDSGRLQVRLREPGIQHNVIRGNDSYSTSYNGRHTVWLDNFQLRAVPEPSTLLFAITGALWTICVRRRCAKH